uniref:Uncharacterized protein n=1 Tax=Anguilla anguilla TaxID=7936 RepID=A0A0E9UMQ2_ANGAN
MIFFSSYFCATFLNRLMFCIDW